MCGTSSAAPTVCGIIALLIQDFRAHFPGRDDPLASTIKILLTHTAFDLGNPGPDYKYGYGAVRAKDAIDFMRTGQFTERQIDQGMVQTFRAEVPPVAPSLKITMAWSDVPQIPNVIVAIVNRLHLRAIDPMGGVHFPWTLFPLNPDVPAVRIQANNIDNMEQVLVDNPIAGIWTIEVSAGSVPLGPQIYSIAGAPGFVNSYLDIALKDPVPSLVAPGDPVTLGVCVTAGNDTIVPGSAKLLYRFDGGAYFETALAPDGDDFTATVPAACCNSVPEFYLGIEGQQVGVIFDPPNGAASPYTYEIGEIETIFLDYFESDLGWTVADSGGLTTGSWERGIPITGCDDGSPETDADDVGVGYCYLTDASGCDVDVDNGTTTLTSVR